MLVVSLYVGIVLGTGVEAIKQNCAKFPFLAVIRQPTPYLRLALSLEAASLAYLQHL